jgi:hypothetical protein
MDNMHPWKYPFETLYGNKFNTPVHWDNLENRFIIFQELLKVKEEEVIIIRQNLNEANYIHKIYANKNKMHMEFSVGDHIFLRVYQRRAH